MSINRYNIEFILNTKRVSAQEIKNYLVEFTDNIEIVAVGEGEFKIVLQAEDPTIIFDTCAQFGRISFVKVNEDEAYGTK